MRRLAYPLAALTLASASCQRTDGLYPVSGRVTYRGVPAAGAAVFFNRRGGDPMAEHMVMGVVRDDGTFELVCGALGKGAPPGEYDVLIDWRPAAGQGGGRPRRGPDRLKGRFADPKHPRLRASVGREATAIPPIELAEPG